MYQHDFTTGRAEQHRADPISDARRARDRRLTSPVHLVTHAKKLAIVTAFTVLASGGIATAAAAPWGGGNGRTGNELNNPVRPLTPNDCIRLNGGDYNACNVGNSGRGDLPYQPVHVLTPNDCIRLNGGDYNACNVGNSGRGDLPYRPSR